MFRNNNNNNRCPTDRLTDRPTDLRSFQVVVLASHWGDEYYHFVTESLPRVMPVLDVLLEHGDIKVGRYSFAADLEGGG